MSSPLERFIRDHREEFDSEEPRQQAWDQNAYLPKTVTGKRTGQVWLGPGRWVAAASISLLIAGSIWYLTYRPGLADGDGNTAHQTARQVKGAQAQGSAAIASAPSAATTPSNQTPPAAAGSGPAASTSDDIDVDQEMVYYAKIIELKQHELKSIKKEEPLLYKQFSGDVDRLDSVYQNLKGQLPHNPNREQLLEAMLQDLQLQMGLLNRQLDIIRQINHSKKNAYEKAYKTT